MKGYRIALVAAAFALPLAAMSPMSAHALSIDLGGVRIKLPSVEPKRRSSRSTAPSSSYSTHPRWATVMEGSYQMATNGQGIWIGYDDTGAMVMQLELPNASALEPGTALPVQVDINGRYYESVIATVANEHLAIVQGAEVERILGRLMSGNSVAFIAGANRLETHLRGSSDAIRKVRSEAQLQARLFESGALPRGEDTQTATTPEAELGDADVTHYYIPGVEEYGVVDVRFDIREGRGLVIFMNFEPIPGHEAPGHAIAMNTTETMRAVSLIRKGEEWDAIARQNRVGLFSKRIGFIDDGLAPKDEPVSGDDSGGAASVAVGPAPVPGAGDAQGGSAQTSGREALPSDFRAVNFNSYETGDTGVQIEHSVGGFSRRFNLALDEALELADYLERTVEVRSQQFETRELSEEQKEELFQ